MLKPLCKKTVSLIIVVMLATFVITACGSQGQKSGSSSDISSSAASSSDVSSSAGDSTAVNPSTSNSSHPQVQFEMENGDKMTFELYPEYAPETVDNFISLTEKDFYNGLTFHRIIKGFMAQGGDPKANGSGGSDKTIKGEFSSNGFTQNTLKHTRGVISMARSKDPNSASSQFFIMDDDKPQLDGDYAAFGKLIDGEKTLDNIMNTPVTQNPNSGDSVPSLPTKEVKIKSVTVLSK